MNRGQMLLVVGALALFASLQLSVNSAILRSSTTSYDGEATVEAISIGQAMIDEIVTQEFDSTTVFSHSMSDPSVFTPSSKLGADVDTEKTVAALERDPFKSQVRFNDIDDYNGYSRIVTSSHLGDFTVKDSVYYVSESDQTTYSSTQTWYKKIVIRVSHPNLLYPVVMKSLIVFRRYTLPS